MQTFIEALCVVAVVAFVVWIVAMQFRTKNDAQDLGSAEHECIECGYDLRASRVRCPECGTLYLNRRHYLNSLANDWPANAIIPRKPGIDEPTVCLLSTENTRELELLKEQLSARGIAFTIELNDWVGDADSKMRYSRVMVYSKDEQFALEYLCRAHGVPIAMLDEVKMLLKQQRVRAEPTQPNVI